MNLEPNSKNTVNNRCQFIDSVGEYRPVSEIETVTTVSRRSLRRFAFGIGRGLLLTIGLPMLVLHSSRYLGSAGLVSPDVALLVGLCSVHFCVLVMLLLVSVTASNGVLDSGISGRMCRGVVRFFVGDFLLEQTIREAERSKLLSLYLEQIVRKNQEERLSNDNPPLHRSFADMEDSEDVPFPVGDRPKHNPEGLQEREEHNNHRKSKTKDLV